MSNINVLKTFTGKDKFLFVNKNHLIGGTNGFLLALTSSRFLSPAWQAFIESLEGASYEILEPKRLLDIVNLPNVEVVDKGAHWEVTVSTEVTGKTSHSYKNKKQGYSVVIPVKKMMGSKEKKLEELLTQSYTKLSGEISRFVYDDLAGLFAKETSGLSCIEITSTGLVGKHFNTVATYELPEKLDLTESINLPNEFLALQAPEGTFGYKVDKNGTGMSYIYTLTDNDTYTYLVGIGTLNKVANPLFTETLASLTKETLLKGFILCKGVNLASRVKYFSTTNLGAYQLIVENGEVIVKNEVFSEALGLCDEDLKLKFNIPTVVLLNWLSLQDIELHILKDGLYFVGYSKSKAMKVYTKIVAGGPQVVSQPVSNHTEVVEDSSEDLEQDTFA